MPDNKRLYLATILSGQTAEQDRKYWEMAQEIQRAAPKSSELARMRFLVAAFLIRTPLTPNEVIGAYQAVEEVIKEHRISRFMPATQVVITVLLTLHSTAQPIDVEVQVIRLLAVYREWKKRHPFLTSGRLLPLMLIALSLHDNHRKLVDDVEAIYAHLLALGSSRSEDTVNFAWAMTTVNLPVERAHQLYAEWLAAFNENKFMKSGVMKATQTLSLLGIEPEEMMDMILYHFHKLREGKALRWHSRYALLHPAIHICLSQFSQGDAAFNIDSLTRLPELKIDTMAVFNLIMLEGASASGVNDGTDGTDGSGEE